MMAAKLVTLTGGGPWGFTLSGGKDFGAHLRVSKVTPGGKAARGGVKHLDYIMTINGDSTEGLLHFDAQQMIKTTGMSLQLKLSSTAPKSPAVAAKFGSHEETDQPAADQSGGRPHPPPPPQSSTTPTKPPTTTYTSVTYPPPPMKSGVAPPDVNPEPSQMVPGSGLETGSFSTQQSPTFKKISIDPRHPTPSVLSPHHEQTSPPTQEMKNVHIETPHTIKTSQRPQPPPNVPSTISSSTVKVRKDAPIPKPQPPPTVTKPTPPPSPGKEQIPEKVVERQGVCASCNQPIRGPFASAMGRVWHPEHFSCISCHKELHNTTFIFEEEKIFCESCYELKFAKSCFGCHRPVVGNAIAAQGYHWHVEHFRCSNCNADLSQGDGFNLEDNRLFCGDCFDAKYGSICHGCGQKIKGEQLWVEAMEHTWHTSCFVCEACRRPLEGTTFFAKLGKPFCRNCA